MQPAPLINVGGERPPDPPLDRRDADRVYGRYRAIVGDWNAFEHALRAPLAPVVWANPTRIDRDALARMLAADGITSRGIAWDASALALGMDRPGNHFAHWAGLYYVQEEASLLPVRVLDPSPGERVLDMCAAPGGKTARIAFALGNRGTLVANDRSMHRMSALSATIARLGLLNVTCTIADGATYPIQAGQFDKILVDAPCSAEGTAPRKSAWRLADPGFRSNVAGAQRALLRRAARLCRTGGRIVYSTCTFAPEENEAVIDAIVRELDGALEIERIDPIEGLAVSPGVSEWNGALFDPRVARTVRLWPHVSGTSGFFVAALRKVHGNDEREHATVRGIDPSESDSLRRFSIGFGFPDDTFEGLRVLTEGRYARLIAREHTLVPGPRHVATGLPIARNGGGGAKLSTAGALAFGRRARTRIVTLERSQTDAFQAREDVSLTHQAMQTCIGGGFVIAVREGHPLGVGILRLRGEARLTSEFPKSWSQTVTGRFD